jgi:molybdate transport repressor ModE-like protein
MRLRSADQWLGLELRHLAALVAVAREGSFGRAAAKLGYTQSAISQQIAALERIVGGVVVERRGGRNAAALTPVGDVLVAHAEQIMGQLVAARSDIAAVHAEQRALSIGVYQSAGAQLLPASLKDFAARRPDVRIRLQESNSDQDLLDLVEEGELDITFAVQPLGDAKLQFIEVLRDPYVLLVPAESRLAALGGDLIPPDLDGLDLIGFRQCRSVLEAEARFRGAGFTPNVAVRSNDNGTMQALVGAGVGAALVPQLVFDRHDDGIVALDLGDRVPPRVLVLAWHPGRRLVTPIDDFAAAVSRAVAALSDATESGADQSPEKP